MVIAFFVILYIAFIIWAIVASRSNSSSKNVERKKDGVYFSVSVTPTRTVYDEQKRLYREEVISDTSNGRMIDGHPLRTQEDWSRWSVYEHKATAIYSSIRKYEKELAGPFCSNPEEIEKLVRVNYSDYERLCSNYGMWNNFIDDRAVYIPTNDQRIRSERFLESISALVPSAIKKRDQSLLAEKIVLDHLQTCYGKVDFRVDVVRLLSDKLDCNSSDAGKMLRLLYKRNVLRETKNKAGRIIVKKARSSSKTENQEVV